MDIVAKTKRHPQAGETVLGNELKYYPGGKGANQAVAAAKLGAKTLMFGKVGGDTYGEQLIAFLKKQNIEVGVMVEPGASTGVAIITVSEETSDNTIVVVPGANLLLAAKDIDNINLEKGDILVSQFEIPIETVTALFKKGKKIGTINILNPAPAQVIAQDLLGMVDILILNETELGFISGSPIDINNNKSIEAAVDKIKIDNLTIVVTIGERGAIVFNNNDVIKIPGRKVRVVDTTGAGDCFVGALAAGLIESKPLPEALVFANIAASISVTRNGAGPSMPSLDEVIALQNII